MLGAIAARLSGQLPAQGRFFDGRTGEYPRGQGEGYADIRERYIDPIDDAYALCLCISTCIANEFGAHG